MINHKQMSYPHHVNVLFLIQCILHRISTINEDTKCYLNCMAEDTQIALCSFLPYQLSVNVNMYIITIFVHYSLNIIFDRELIHLSQTNKMWCNIITDDLVWRIVFRVKLSFISIITLI